MCDKRMQKLWSRYKERITETNKTGVKVKRWSKLLHGQRLPLATFWLVVIFYAKLEWSIKVSNEG